MVQHTRQYEEEHDDWKEFRDTFLRREGEGCGWRDVLHSFKEWHKEHVGDKPPGEREIKTYFEKHLGPEKNNKVNKKPLRGFKGWKLIEPRRTHSLAHRTTCNWLQESYTPILAFHTRRGFAEA